MINTSDMVMAMHAMVRNVMVSVGTITAIATIGASDLTHTDGW